MTTHLPTIQPRLRWLMAFAWIISSTLASRLAWSEIRTVQGWAEALSHMPQTMDSETWVLVDVDYTIMEPSHPALHRSFLYDGHPLTSEQEQCFTGSRTVLDFVRMMQHPMRLVEECVPASISEIRQRGGLIMGFTYLETSVVPPVGESCSWRAADLHRLGVELSHEPLARGASRVELTSLSPHRGTYPLFHAGVLYCNGTHPKGPVLESFCQHIGHRPRRVIMIDDTHENLVSVEQVLQRHNIPFLGLHYANPYLKSPPELTREEHLDGWNAIHRSGELAAIPTGQISTAHTTALAWAIETLPENSLVIFDVGQVLYTYQDRFISCPFGEWRKQWLKTHVPDQTYQEYRDLLGIMEDHAQVELVFAEMPNLVRRAQERHQVIALSRYPCGPYGDGTTTFEAEHLRKLRSLGIDLGDPLELPTHWCADPHAVYLSGMIQSEQNLKGPVLAELLASLPSLPPAILFVDDREMQCRSVAEMAEALQIPCLCIHLDRTLEGLAPLDEELAERQMHSWVYEHAWLSDAEALQPVRTTN